jgi:hypothetical protein
MNDNYHERGFTAGLKEGIYHERSRQHRYAWLKLFFFVVVLAALLAHVLFNAIGLLI